MKHKDIIIAWLNGAKVEYKYPSEQPNWRQLGAAEDSFDMPMFSDEYDYRIVKPKPEWRIVSQVAPSTLLGAYCCVETRNTGTQRDEYRMNNPLSVGEWTLIPEETVNALKKDMS